MNGAAVLWVGAAFLGFVVWWPIGVAFLTAITVTAICQQLTGYRPPQQSQPGPIHIGEANRHATLRQIEADQREVALITNRLRNAKSDAEFNRIMSSQKKIGGY